jgi:hypothetical protein
VKPHQNLFLHQIYTPIEAVNRPHDNDSLASFYLGTIIEQVIDGGDNFSGC